MVNRNLDDVEKCLFAYTWVSLGLEVVSWLLLAIFRAARAAAYIVVNWMLLGCAGVGVDTKELLKRRRERLVAGRSLRSGSNIYSVSLVNVAQRLRSTVLVLDAS